MKFKLLTNINWNKPDELIGKFFSYARNPRDWTYLIWYASSEGLHGVDLVGIERWIQKEEICTNEEDWELAAANPDLARHFNKPIWGIFETPYSEGSWINKVDELAQKKRIDRSKIHFGYSRQLTEEILDRIVKGAVNKLNKIKKANLEIIQYYQVEDIWQICLKDTRMDKKIICYLNRSVLLLDSVHDGDIGAEGKQLKLFDLFTVRVANIIYKEWFKEVRDWAMETAKMWGGITNKEAMEIYLGA